MPLVQLGRNNLAALAVSTGNMRPWNSTGAYLIVGDSTTAYAPTDTWLLGTNSTMKAMNANYPSRATNVLSFQATFSTDEAIFPWNEWAVTNTTSTADGAQSLFNRKVEDPSLGTKTSAQSWQFSADITVTT